MWSALFVFVLFAGAELPPDFYYLQEPAPPTAYEEMAILAEIAQQIEIQREEQRQLELEQLLAKQELLKDLGWYEGQVDGIHGPLTERAIERFSEAAEVEPEPESEVLLAALNEDGAPTPPPPPPPPEPEPAPAPSDGSPNGSSSGIASHWIRLAECESGNWINGGQSFEAGSARWQWAKPGAGVPSWGTTIHHGGLQFLPSTWNWVAPMVGLGHIDYAYNATPQEQVRVAERLQELQGWGAWPVCSRKTGLR